MSLVKFSDVVQRANTKEDKDNTDKIYYVGGEHIDSNNVLITERGIIKGSTIGPMFYFGFKAGQVLFVSRNPHLRKAGMVTFDGICSEKTFVLETKNEDVLLQRFLPFIMQSNHFWNYMEAHKSGSVNYFINWSTLANYEFELPDIEEQKRLTELLWAIKDTKYAYEKLSQSIDEVVKSQFIEMFKNNSKEVKLTDYVWFQEGPGVRKVDFTDEGTILLTGSNINNNQISFGTNADRFISNELASGKYNHFLCDKGDILVVASAIAPEKFDEKVVIVTIDKEYCLNTGIIRFKPNLEYMTKAYFVEFLKSDFFKRQVSKEMSGICQMHFGPSHLKKMRLLLPDSIDDQIVFEEFAKQSDKSKFEIKQCIETTEKLLHRIIDESIN